MDLNSRAQLILTGLGIVSGIVAWWRYVRPRLRRGAKLVYAALVSLGGRDPIEDALTGRSLPAIPPLHVRLGSIEERQNSLATTQATQAEALNKLVDVHRLISEMHRVQSDHEARIGSLEDVDAERSLAREESAAMWRSVADKDVIDSEGREIK